MGWNGYGGSGGNGPQRGGGRREWPPGPSKALAYLLGTLRLIFGGIGFASGAPFGRGKGLGLLALVLSIAWGLAGVYVVEPAEQGVVLRFGKHVRSTGPGPHWAPFFIETVEKVNVAQIRSEELGYRNTGLATVLNESLMLTRDENIIELQFAVQYRVRDAADYLFQVTDPDTTVRQATESAVREMVGKHPMDFVITVGRTQVAAEAGRLIQAILDRYRIGLVLTSVNMLSAQPPQAVQEAFLDAIRAREDQARIINEAKAYKADVVPKARGEAKAIKERAEAYRQRVIAGADGETSRFLQVLEQYRRAPAVTRERLYLETMESVLAHSSKVLVDLPGGNGPTSRLLDQLTAPRAAGANARPPFPGFAE